MTPETIASLAGLIISVIFSYFPILRVKYAALSEELKSVIMIALMILAGFAAWGAGCIGWVETNLACDVSSVQKLIWLILVAIATNQGVHRISPQTNDVKLAKIMRQYGGPNLG